MVYCSIKPRASVAMCQHPSQGKCGRIGLTTRVMGVLVITVHAQDKLDMWIVLSSYSEDCMKPWSTWPLGIPKICRLRVLAHSLSAKNPPNWPLLLGHIKLTTAVPRVILFMQASKYQEKAPTWNEDWKSIASQEIYPSPFWTSQQYCTATAVV